MSHQTIEGSLWGELPVDIKIETPLSILKAQAAILSKVSGGLLEGKVSKYENREYQLSHELQIVVPALGNYSLAVVSIQHQITLYPVTVYANLENKEWACDDAEELKEQLGFILQGESVRRAVGALLAQANDAGNKPVWRTASK